MIPWAAPKIVLAGMALWISLAVWAALPPQRQAGIGDGQVQDELAIQQNATHVEDLERRVTNIETQRLSERIATLEATSESNHNLLLSVLCGLVLLVIERGFAFSKTFRRGRE